MSWFAQLILVLMTLHCPLHPQKWPSSDDKLHCHPPPRGFLSSWGICLLFPPHSSPRLLSICPAKASATWLSPSFPRGSSHVPSLFWVNVSPIGVHTSFPISSLFCPHILLMVASGMGRVGHFKFVSKVALCPLELVFCSSVHPTGQCKVPHFSPLAIFFNFKLSVVFFFLKLNFILFFQMLWHHIEAAFWCFFF